MTNLPKDTNSKDADTQQANPKDMSQLVTTIDNLENRLQNSLNREKRFASQASHELNTPLTIINSYVDMAANLAKQGNTAKVQEVLNKAQLGIKQLQQTIQQLLVLSKLDSLANSEDIKNNNTEKNRSTAVDIIYDAMATLSERDMARITLPKDLPEDDCHMNLELGSTALKNLIEHVLASSERPIKIQVISNEEHVHFIVSNITVSNIIDSNTNASNTEADIETANRTLENNFKNHNDTDEIDSFVSHGLGITIVMSIAELYQGKLLQSVEPLRQSPSDQHWVLVLKLSQKLYEQK